MLDTAASCTPNTRLPAPSLSHARMLRSLCCKAPNSHTSKLAKDSCIAPISKLQHLANWRKTRASCMHYVFCSPLRHPAGTGGATVSISCRPSALSISTSFPLTALPPYSGAPQKNCPHTTASNRILQCMPNQTTPRRHATLTPSKPPLSCLFPHNHMHPCRFSYRLRRTHHKSP